jgi:hypothetical protein
MSKHRTFRLSTEEVKYISTLMLEDNEFRSLLPSRLEVCIDQQALTLDHDEAELLRDYFTDRLARVGFDENYEPNQEGVMLERLTDLLFLPEEKWKTGDGGDAP